VLICYLIFINYILKIVSISKQAFLKASLETGYDVLQNFRQVCVISSRIICLRLSSVLSDVWYTIILINPYRKKSQAVKSCEHGGHGIILFREIMWFGNKSFRIFILTLAVWNVASFIVLARTYQLQGFPYLF